MLHSQVTPLTGELYVPGDKSISHRAIMLASLAKGTSEITHFLNGADCLSTIDCFRKMGVAIDFINEPKDAEQGLRVRITGRGLHGLQKPSCMLDAGNSGTTTRLISGILSGQRFPTTLTGDASIQKRPMKRIMEPLTQMGASISSLNGNGCAPLEINGHSLHGIHYHSPIASAQVKSAILLAGLYADGATSVSEPALSRNHTEIMLRSFGADVKSEGLTATLMPGSLLEARRIDVPGDISSAAYFLAAATLVPGSLLLLKNVGINPTRDGFLRAARAMGASFSLEKTGRDDGEDAADILVSHAPLHGTTIGGELIPTLIDEIPILAIMAAFAKGTTVIRDAAELRVKESDRIAVMVENLRAMGCDIEATADGMIIRGGKPLHGAQIDSHGDHRIAMSFTIASLLAEGDVHILEKECVHISYPRFYRDLAGLTAHPSV